jgi:uncharacterized protein YdeI (YjbR/CyaY-like superfamily)
MPESKSKTLYVKNRDEWRRWLQKNHHSENEIWLIYYKKHSGKPRIPYNDAVEEALCFGWIDSLVKTIDHEKYMQKYTPRKQNSVWSELNVKRCEKMIKEGKMAKTGFALIEEAQKNGNWEKAYTDKKTFEPPKKLIQALKKSKTAWNNFNNFAPSYKNNYIAWVVTAKREETKNKRIFEVVKRSEKNQKPGML